MITILTVNYLETPHVTMQLVCSLSLRVPLWKDVLNHDALF